MKPTYKMVGFSQKDGPMFEESVTADRAQEIAEDKDLIGYLLDAPWQAATRQRSQLV